MTHQSVTDTTWISLELFRKDAIESQETNQQQGPLFHTTWEYFEAAKQAYTQKCASCVELGGQMRLRFLREQVGYPVIFLPITFIAIADII